MFLMALALNQPIQQVPSPIWTGLSIDWGARAADLQYYLLDGGIAGEHMVQKKR